ncbi:Glycosyl transferase family 11 [Butyrivibrio fibrisolvens DSM 3071]|uniref:Glycosyl transferase family 11 n=1 Tax=Butyrivibrio fibrisolvens DSM 3071 TaxID=1121131 RepID=A0A1M5XTZ3_BUTFI|nr:alpha-1,2-fucosyltransferase [Butyrivibrio fibrisolvens]SHI02998.1 Glycosyl transferase family 11 [Butyrivibrio fibrisolvens DSM 3071]
MIIIRVAGGLGNQMQQYAMYRKLKSLGKDVKLDLSWFDADSQKGLAAPRKCELKYFKDLPMDVCSNDERGKFVNRSFVTKTLNKLIPSTSRIFEESKMYHPEIFDLEDKYLEGFFLCNKYYADIMPQLQKDFVFPLHSDPKKQEINEALMDEMMNKNGGESACIHLRRGDYVTQQVNVDLFGNIATDAYYDAAVEYVLSKSPDAHFYIFSNDPEYAEEKYPDRARFTIVTGNEGTDSLLDMQLMSRCKYNICANSTFSFWGARLNARPDKIMIRTYKMRNNQDVVEDLMHDYWQGWVLIDENGIIR